MNKEKHEYLSEELTKEEKIEIIMKYYSKDAIFNWMLENEFMDGTEPKNSLKNYIEAHIDELWDQLICN